MAQRRMFNKDITSSDSFTDLPLSAQALYLHLTMEADDDGLVSSARKITRSIGASPEDLQALLEARFLLDLGDNIICIKHWRMNNYIQKDRYKPSMYAEKMAMLYIKDNKAYTLNPAEGVPVLEAVENVLPPVENYEQDDSSAPDFYSHEQQDMELEAEENPQTLGNTDASNLYTECIQDVYKMDTQASIGKVSIDKASIVKPSLLSSSKKKHAYGPHKNVMLTDEERATLEGMFKYPTALIYAVSNYLVTARDRPPDKSNHYALCLKIGREDGAELLPAAQVKEA